MQKIVYINIDGIIAEYESKLVNETKTILNSDHHEFLSFYYEALPVPLGGIEAVNFLLSISDIKVYFISSPSWSHSEDWLEKKEWLGQLFTNKMVRKRLFLCHQKHLLKGDYLIDQCWRHGARKFKGTWIHIGVDSRFSSWDDVLEFLIEDLNS